MNEYLVTCTLIHGCYSKSYYAPSKKEAILNFKIENNINYINKANFFIIRK